MYDNNDEINLYTLEGDYEENDYTDIILGELGLGFKLKKPSLKKITKVATKVVSKPVQKVVKKVVPKPIQQVAKQVTKKIPTPIKQTMLNPALILKNKQIQAKLKTTKNIINTKQIKNVINTSKTLLKNPKIQDAIIMSAAAAAGQPQVGLQAIQAKAMIMNIAKGNKNAYTESLNDLNTLAKENPNIDVEAGIKYIDEVKEKTKDVITDNLESIQKVAFNILDYAKEGLLE